LKGLAMNDASVGRGNLEHVITGGVSLLEAVHRAGSWFVIHEQAREPLAPARRSLETLRQQHRSGRLDHHVATRDRLAGEARRPAGIGWKQAVELEGKSRR
jgi:hypothetical protein